MNDIPRDLRRSLSIPTPMREHSRARIRPNEGSDVCAQGGGEENPGRSLVNIELLIRDRKCIRAISRRIASGSAEGKTPRTATSTAMVVSRSME